MILRQNGTKKQAEQSASEDAREYNQTDLRRSHDQSLLTNATSGDKGM
jgi:hypothetical protein